MNERYCECLVARRTDGKNKLFVFLSGFLAVMCIVLLLLSASLFLFIPAILFCVVTWYTYQLTKVEFEYLFLDHDLTVDRILNKARRKQMWTGSVRDIECLAPADSDAVRAYSHKKRTAYDFSTAQEKDRHYKLFVKRGAGLDELCLTPNEELLEILRMELPAYVFRRE